MGILIWYEEGRLFSPLNIPRLTCARRVLNVGICPATIARSTVLCPVLPIMPQPGPAAIPVAYLQVIRLGRALAPLERAPRAHPMTAKWISGRRCGRPPRSAATDKTASFVPSAPVAGRFSRRRRTMERRLMVIRQIAHL